VFGTNTFHCNAPMRDLAAGRRIAVEFVIDSMRLGIGSFSLTTALHTGESHVAANYDWWDRALVFQVVKGEGPTVIGVCNLPVSVSWGDANLPEAVRPGGSNG
jgi:lipopolysaccharide transport system ATP-binding protein